MSAQIITALRKRADALDAEADEDKNVLEPGQRVPYARSSVALRYIAAEFRALADAAEGLEC